MYERDSMMETQYERWCVSSSGQLQQIEDVDWKSGTSLHDVPRTTKRGRVAVGFLSPGIFVE